MKKMLEPLPYTEAEQHTLACVLLGLCENLVESYGSPELPFALEAISKAAAEAMTQTQNRKRRISQGARRAWERYADALSKHTAGIPVEQAFRMWAALTWVAFAFSYDCKNCAPIYSQGKFMKAWQKIHYWLERLAYENMIQYPGCDEIGCGIYEECAYALEGEEFRAEQLYA